MKDTFKTTIVLIVALIIVLGVGFFTRNEFHSSATPRRSPVVAAVIHADVAKEAVAQSRQVLVVPGENTGGKADRERITVGDPVADGATFQGAGAGGPFDINIVSPLQAHGS